MQPLVSRRSGPLSGRVRVPGDKSISHRALMLGALAQGVTVIDGLLEGEDVHRTAAAMVALGASVTAGEDGRWRVEGVGDRPLSEPAAVLDMGNSGTSTRLLSGVLAGQPLTAFMTGDASLTKRPMARVTEPLSRMGARFVTRTGGRLPMAVIGTERLQPIRYVLPVASAQVKSAILLAGLAAAGTTTVVEREATRDHSELMLRHFGAEVRVGPAAEGGEAISILGGQRLTARPVIVPADISSAAFPMVAALIRPGSSILLEGVGVNTRRAGLIQTLVEMGARVELQNRRVEAGEPVADLAIEYSALAGIEVPPERAPSMIDEYPVLAVAAACAGGTTHMRGLAELRVKESDRLAVMADGLTRCGVRVDVGNDSLTVYGTGKPPAGGATVETQLDHRIAMSFLVLGAATAEPVAVDDAGPIDTSFPGFVTLMNGLGAAIAPQGPPGSEAA